MAGKKKGKRASNVGRRTNNSNKSRAKTSAISTETTKEIPLISSNNGSLETFTAPSPSTSRDCPNFNGNNDSSSAFISEEPNCNGITPADLLKLLQEATAARLSRRSDTDTVMLLDCRMEKDYSKSTIKFTNVVNVPPFVFDKDKDANQEFTSKREVIKFIQGRCPHLLEKLNSPGHYTDVILIDESLTTTLTSPSLKIMQLAMLKWSESTKTSIKLLHGGISAFSKQFPDNLITKTYLAGRPSPLPALGTTLRKNTKRKWPKGSIEEKMLKKTLEGITTHLKNSDKVMYTRNDLITLSYKCISFNCVKIALLQEHYFKLLRHLETKICFEIYSGQSIQCGNGHCVCGACVAKITFCPECKLPYNVVGKVRNQVLETLMAKSLRCKCLCGESVTCKDAVKHAWFCATEKNKYEEVKKLEAEISLMKKEKQKLEKKLEEEKKLLGEK